MTGVQTCALPISRGDGGLLRPPAWQELVGGSEVSRLLPEGGLDLGVQLLLVPTSPVPRRPMFLPLPDPGLLCDSGPRPPLSGPVSLLSSRLDSMSPRPFRPGHRVTSAAQGHQRLSPLSRGPGLLLGPRLAWPPCPQQEHPSHLRDRLSVPPPPALALFRLQNNVYHFTLHDTLPSSFLPSFPPLLLDRKSVV